MGEHRCEQRPRSLDVPQPAPLATDRVCDRYEGPVANIASSTNYWNAHLEHAVVSDVGLQRANNQDAYVVVTATNQERWREKGHLFAVADGMGAHAAGETASRLAVDSLAHAYLKLDAAPLAALKQAIIDANRLIHARGQSSVDFHGMGTTCSALLLLPEGAIVANVGDSRVYRVRQDTIEQLTFDHSLQWEMMAATRLAEEDVAHCVPRNVITRSLGPNPTVEVDVEGPFPVRSGDRYLLCSDGLSGLVKDEELGILLGCLDVEDAVHALVALALMRGGHDNITAMAVHLTQSHEPVRAEQLARDRKKRDEPVPPDSAGPLVLASFAGFSLIVALVTLAWGRIGPAIISLAIGLTAGLAAWMRKGGSIGRQTKSKSHGRTHQAPYRHTVCQPNAEFVRMLAEGTERLRQAAQDDKLAIDWKSVDAWMEEAAFAGAKGKLQRAIQQYARAVRGILGQLRPRLELPSLDD
jgi:protein phosphatase